MESKDWRVSACMLVFAAALMGCGKEDGGATGPEDKSMLEGTLRLPDGKPAAGATVRFYPVDHVPGPENAAKRSAQDVAYSTRTDAEGRYAVDSLPRGEYNLIAEKDGLVALEDSVFLAPGVRTEVSGNLAVAGAVTARVEIQPHHDTRAVTVQVLGTSVFSNVDEDGRFTLGGMAAGRYRLRIETSEEGYTTLFTSVAVRSGEADTLRASLRPDYTGIPVVTGLKVHPDTLAGVARITWNAAKYKRLKHYVISRGPAGAVVPMRQSVGVTAETTFVDTLFGASRDDFGFGSSTLYGKLEYEVRVRNLSEGLGPIFGTVQLDAVPPASVTTALDLQWLGTQDGEASLHDTVKVVFRFQNPGRDLVAVVWREDGGEDPVRDARLRSGTRAGTDTLVLVQHTASRRGGVVQVFDDGGQAWPLRFEVRYARKFPSAIAGPDLVGNQGDTLRMSGRGATAFGRIVKQEWDIGATGEFASTPDGKASVILPDSMTILPCVFRVTNEDGETSTDTLLATARRRWQPIQQVPFRGNHGQWVRFKDRIWHFGGLRAPGQSSSVHSSGDMLTWRPETDSAVVTSRKNFAAFVIGDTLWIAGGELADGSGRVLNDLWWTVDGVRWTRVDGHGMQNLDHVWTSQIWGKTWIYPPNTRISWLRTAGGKWASDRVFDHFTCQLNYVATMGDVKVLGCNRDQTILEYEDGNQRGFRDSPLSGKTDVAWIETDRSLLLFGGFVEGEPVDTRILSTRNGKDWILDSTFPRPIHRAPLGLVHEGHMYILDEGELFRAR